MYSSVDLTYPREWGGYSMQGHFCVQKAMDVTKWLGGEDYQII